MSMNKLIKDINMNLEVIDLSEDEKTGFNLKDGTVNINLEQNETETNNGERKNLIKNENAPEINWDLLEMESDHEQVKSQKESQESDNSVVVLEVGSGSLPFSSRDEHIIMMDGDSLVLNMEGGNDDMKGLSQNIVVSSNESMVGLENMRVQLTSVNELTNQNREGLILSSENSSVIIDAEKKCVSKRLKQFDLPSEHKLPDINYVEGLNEHSDSGTCADLRGSSSISVVGSIRSEDHLKKIEFGSIFPKKDATGDENVEGAYGNVDFVLQGGVNCEGLPKDGEAKDMGDEVDHEKLNLEGGNANSSAFVGDSDMNGSELTLDTSARDPPVGSGHGVEINRDQTDLEPTLRSVLDSNWPEKNTKGDENVEGAYGNMDFVLQGSVNCEGLPKDGEAKDMGDEVDHEKLNLEGGNANSSAVGGDSDMNGLELTMDTSVRSTPLSVGQGAELNGDQTFSGCTLTSVLDSQSPKRRSRPRKEKKNTNDANAGAGQGAEINRDQKDLEPTLRSVLNSKSPKRRGRPRKEKKNMNDANAGAGQGAEINRDQADLEPTLRSVLDSKSPKRRGRPRKEKKNMNDANANSALIVCNIAESSSSRRKRERRESKYLSFPYTSINEGSLKRPRKEGKMVENAGDDKAERSSEEVVLDLIAAAQGPLTPENSFLTKSTRGLVISFRDSLSSEGNAKNSQEVAAALSPVLLDARGKLEDIIMSLNGSDLESKESLIRDAWGLLEKVNLALTNDGTIGIFF